MQTKLIIGALVVIPIVLELAVAFVRRQTAGRVARKLVGLASVQAVLPVAITGIVMLFARLAGSHPDDLWSRSLTFGMIAIGLYGFTWLVTTIAGLVLIQETQQSDRGATSEPAPIAGSEAPHP